MTELDALLARLADPARGFATDPFMAAGMLPKVAKRLAEAERFEAGFREIATVILGPRKAFEIPGIVTLVTAMSAQLAAVTDERDALRKDRERLVVALESIQSECRQSLEHDGSEYEDEPNLCQDEGDSCTKCFVYNTSQSAIDAALAASSPGEKS